VVHTDELENHSCFLKYSEKVENEDVIFNGSCPLSISTVFPEKYTYSYPVFNPNNSNEIAYQRRDTELQHGWNDELWVFNFCTGESRFLTDKIGYSPDWSVKDWIVFTGKDRQLWKIKSTGDSLLQLTNAGGFNNHPSWNSEGDKIAYRHSSSTLGNHFLLADELGKTIDTISNFLVRSWDWEFENISFVKEINNEDVLQYYNLKTGEFKILDVAPIMGTSDSMLLNTIILKGHKAVLWNQMKQIGYTKILNGKRVILKKGADNRLYMNISISNSNQEVLAERVDIERISICKKEERRNLFLINVDSKEERKIDLPE